MLQDRTLQYCFRFGCDSLSQAALMAPGSAFGPPCGLRSEPGSTWGIPSAERRVTRGGRDDVTLVHPLNVHSFLPRPASTFTKRTAAAAGDVDGTCDAAWAWGCWDVSAPSTLPHLVLVPHCTDKASSLASGSSGRSYVPGQRGRRLRLRLLTLRTLSYAAVLRASILTTPTHLHLPMQLLCAVRTRQTERV